MTAGQNLNTLFILNCKLIYIYIYIYIVIVNVIVIVLVDGKAGDPLAQSAGLLSLDDVTALEVDWRLQFTREAKSGLKWRIVGA